MGCWGGAGRGAVGGARLVGGPFQPGLTGKLGAPRVLGTVLFTIGIWGGVLLFVSQVPMSMLCLPGIIGPGGMPGPFFFSPWFWTVSWGFAGWLAMLAHVAFFGWPKDSLESDDTAFKSVFAS